MWSKLQLEKDWRSWILQSLSWNQLLLSMLGGGGFFDNCMQRKIWSLFSGCKYLLHVLDEHWAPIDVRLCCYDEGGYWEGWTSTVICVSSAWCGCVQSCTQRWLATTLEVIQYSASFLYGGIAEGDVSAVLWSLIRTMFSVQRDELGCNWQVERPCLHWWGCKLSSNLKNFQGQV